MEDQVLHESHEQEVLENQPQNEQQVVENQPSQERNSVTPQESFRQLREKAERAERERDELRQMMHKMYEQNTKPKQEEPDEDPSELIERRHLKQYDSEMKRMRQELQQTRQSMAEERLKTQYPDFDRVVNEQTIGEFRKRNPGLAASIAQTEDLYEKAQAAYTLIKNMGIYQEDNYGPDRHKAETNSAKPRPSNTISPQRGESPLSHANAFANGLTEDLRKQLWREMEQARKGQ